MATILVVDDDTRSCEMACESLKGQNLNVIQAGSAEEAMPMLRQESVDLIVLDLLLPGKKGWEFALELSQIPQTSKIPVLVSSILAPQDTDIQRNAGNVAGYIVKPYEAADLVREVRNILENKS